LRIQANVTLLSKNKYNIGAGMLLGLFVSTTVNTKLKDNQTMVFFFNQTMFSASVLAWRILFRSVIGAGMLLEFLYPPP
jgi:hypothetical protein